MNIPAKKETIMLELNRAEELIFEEKNKDEGARSLRIVLEKVIQKIAQQNSISLYNQKEKPEKISALNDNLKKKNVLKKVDWEENKTCLVIGNHASHGEYDEYNLRQVENFFQHIQRLLNIFNI
jgi:adenine-specific DNA-methyltransferase